MAAQCLVRGVVASLRMGSGFALWCDSARVRGGGPSSADASSCDWAELLLLGCFVRSFLLPLFSALKSSASEFSASEFSVAATGLSCFCFCSAALCAASCCLYSRP